MYQPWSLKGLGFVQSSENRQEELVGHVHVLDIGRCLSGTLDQNLSKWDTYFGESP